MVAKVVWELNVDGVLWELENVVRWLNGAVGTRRRRLTAWSRSCFARCWTGDDCCSGRF